MKRQRVLMIRDSQGFSLVELMVTLVIGLILISGVVVVFVANQAAISQAQSLSRVQENMRFSSDFLIRDIRNAGFRDEASLSYSDFLDLGERPVSKEEGDFGDILTVSYAGRGDCNEEFGDPGDPVERVYNRYEVADGGLFCNGRLLVSGVERFTADGLCPDGSPTCICPENCVGILATLVFEGQGRGNPSRSVQLKALFRNRILESVFQD